MGARTCAIDTVLPRGGGATGDSPIFIQAGTKVDMHFGVMQRDPDFWGPDAEEFRPERWQTVRPKWEYIPFLVSSLHSLPQGFGFFRLSWGSRIFSVSSESLLGFLVASFDTSRYALEVLQWDILTRNPMIGRRQDMPRTADGVESDGLRIGNFCKEVRGD